MPEENYSVLNVGKPLRKSLVTTPLFFKIHKSVTILTKTFELNSFSQTIIIHVYEHEAYFGTKFKNNPSLGRKKKARATFELFNLRIKL